MDSINVPILEFIAGFLCDDDLRNLKLVDKNTNALIQSSVIMRSRCFRSLSQCAEFDDVDAFICVYCHQNRSRDEIIDDVIRCKLCSYYIFTCELIGYTPPEFAIMSAYHGDVRVFGIMSEGMWLSSCRIKSMLKSDNLNQIARDSLIRSDPFVQSGIDMCTCSVNPFPHFENGLVFNVLLNACDNAETRKIIHKVRSNTHSHFPGIVLAVILGSHVSVLKLMHQNLNYIPPFCHDAVLNVIKCVCDVKKCEILTDPCYMHMSSVFRK